MYVFIIHKSRKILIIFIFIKNIPFDTTLKKHFSRIYNECSKCQSLSRWQMTFESNFRNTFKHTDSEYFLFLEQDNFQIFFLIIICLTIQTGKNLEWSAHWIYMGKDDFRWVDHQNNLQRCSSITYMAYCTILLKLRLALLLSMN